MRIRMMFRAVHRAFTVFAPRLDISIKTRGTDGRSGLLFRLSKQRDVNPGRLAWTNDRRRAGEKRFRRAGLAKEAVIERTILKRLKNYNKLSLIIAYARASRIIIHLHIEPFRCRFNDTPKLG